MEKRRFVIALVLLAAFAANPCRLLSQQPAAAGTEKVILDTDIGDDIDDAFALGLVLSNPRMQLLGVTTAWGNTALRARLASRLLCDVGRGDVPVYAGPRTETSNAFTQAQWASRFPDRSWPDAVPFILDQIRKYPGEVTLISIAPLTNVGKVIDADPAAFKKLKKVVIMGGSVYRGYGDLGYRPNHGPEVEYNIKMDVAAAQKLFRSGVPLYVMPLDSTQLKLDETLRTVIFSHGSPLTDDLTLLYEQWTAGTQNPTPTLFDAMAVAEDIRPDLCPTTAMHIVVDDQGFTRVGAGAPNANVCLESDSSKFFEFYLRQVLAFHATATGTKGPCAVPPESSR